MQERERVVVAGLMILMLILWLGFAVHRSPAFAGSPVGGILGVSGGLLIAVSYTYALVKRFPAIKNVVTKRVSLRTLLAWHIYAAIAGSILGLLHTGHKFESTLGILLTSTMLLLVLTGFIGRYLLNLTSQEIREKRDVLSKLQEEYDAVSLELGRHPELAQALAGRGFLSRAVAGFLVPTSQLANLGYPAAARAIRVAESIADVDYSIRSHEALKKAFSRWLKVHIVLSVVFIILLGIHIWSGINYG